MVFLRNNDAQSATLRRTKWYFTKTIALGATVVPKSTHATNPFQERTNRE